MKTKDNHIQNNINICHIRHVFKKTFLALFALLFFAFSAEAHTWEIRVKQNQDGTLTWYGQSYHVNGQCALSNSGISINNVNYNWTAAFSDSNIVQFPTVLTVSPIQLDYNDNQNFNRRLSYATVTTPYIAGNLNVLAYSNNVCWDLYFDMPAGNGSFTPPPPPVCTTCPVTGFTNTVVLPGNNNMTPCDPTDDFASAVVTVNHLACASITGDGQFDLVFDQGGSNIVYGPINYSTGITTDVTINIPFGASSSTQINLVDADFPCNYQASMTIAAQYLGEVDAVPPTISCPGDIRLSNDPGFCSGTTTLAEPMVSDNCSSKSGAINLDGSNDYINIGAAIPSNSSYTKEAWVYQTQTLAYNNIISSGGTPLWIPGGYLSAGQAGGYSYVTDATLFPLNAWTHVAVTYDAATTTLTLYKNGVQVGVNNSVPAFTSQTNYIGVHQPAYSNFKGSIDEVRIWTTARTQVQIQANMNGEIAAQADLVQYFKFNQGVAGGANPGITTAADASGNSNDGTLINFSLTGSNSNWVDGNTTLNTLQLSNDAPATYPIGNTTVTWTVTDANNNSASCTQVVTVEDNENPMITCPSNITINNDAGQCGAIANYIAPVGSDNCPGAVTTLTAGLASGSLFPLGTTTVTYTVTEAPNPITLFYDEFSDNSNGWLLGTEWGIAPTAANNCGTGCTGGSDPALDHSSSADNGIAGVVPGGCASTTQHGFYYLTSPVINNNIPGTVLMEYYRHLQSDYPPYAVNVIEVFDGSAWILLWEKPPNSPCFNDLSWTLHSLDVTAYKNANFQVRFGFNITSNGVYTMPSWSIDDFKIHSPNSSKTNSCSFTVTVEDNENPIITCPGNASISNQTDVCGSTYTYVVTATDNCPGELITQTAGLPSGSLFPMGTTTNSFKVTDASGNMATCSFDVTVNFDPSTVVAYTILAEESVDLHDDNLVSGNVGVWKAGKKAKLHKSSHIYGFLQAPDIDLKNGSTVSGNQNLIQAPMPTAASFRYNTMSSNVNVNVPDNYVGVYQIVGSNFDKIDIGKNATVQFMNTGDIFIKELKSKGDKNSSTYILFSGNTDLLIKKKMELKKATDFNQVGGYTVNIYCEDGHVKIDENSNITANIDVRFKKLDVHGKIGETTYMSGRFIAKLVHGHKDVVWNGACTGPSNTAPSSRFVAIPIAEHADELSTAVYPNPNNGVFTIMVSTNSEEPINGSIYEMTGKKVSNLPGIEANTPYNVSNHLSDGVYFINIQVGNKQQSVKMIKKD